MKRLTFIAAAIAAAVAAQAEMSFKWRSAWGDGRTMAKAFSQSVTMDCGQWFAVRSNGKTYDSGVYDTLAEAQAALPTEAGQVLFVILAEDLWAKWQPLAASLHRDEIAMAETVGENTLHILFREVSYSSPVPEPTSGLLFVIGTACAMLRRKGARA